MDVVTRDNILQDHRLSFGIYCAVSHSIQDMGRNIAPDCPDIVHSNTDYQTDELNSLCIPS